MPIELPQIRPFAAADLEQVVELERISFEGSGAFTKREVKRELRRRGTEAMVACHPGADSIVLGWTIYQVFSEDILLCSLAVFPEFRRRSIGTALLEQVKRKLSHCEQELLHLVRETNLASQLFLRANGFRAVGFTYGEVQEDAGEMAIEFCYDLLQRSPATLNRLATYFAGHRV